MISFPNAKINLGLTVRDKRGDGFHNIETIFYPVEMCDILEIVPSGAERTTFETTGISIPGTKEDNLCLKAVSLLSSSFEIPALRMHLHKVIPAGSGLGGGSSDAAYTIRMLNDVIGFCLTAGGMMDYARKLGSDCAFFVENKPVFAYGKGDRFEPVSLNLKEYRVEIITPGIHVNTAEAYRMIDELPQKPGHRPSLKEIIDLPVAEWKNLMANDFEIPVFRKYPELARIKQELYDRGAVYASMSGSGSALFGIFQKV